MATLVLTAVGTIVGGPIGGAIGAALGQAADQALFAPKPREGPRLGNLAVQTSSYGSVIPKIFGTMRVAGTVVWATDIREERSTSGGGKGQPKTANYTYSASFAVALSGRPLRAIRRIWADGKLLRGAAGDFKARTGFRFYGGSEDQPVDPLIAAAEGAGQAPAFRGIAYALFEDLALEDFGNRIPSLSFEVEADEGDLSIGEIAAELSDSIVKAGETPRLGGYAASGESVRSAVEALAHVVPLWLRDDSPAVTIEAVHGEVGSIGENDRVGALTGSRRGSGKLPIDVSLAYYERQRDYQLGLQRAFRPGAGKRSDRRELPAVLTARQAKGFAEQRLAQLWAGAARSEAQLPWRMAHFRPGTHVRFPRTPDLWRVERWTFGSAGVKLDLTRVAASRAAQPEEASPGRPIVQRDRVHGPTVLRLYDLPSPDETLSRPLIVAFAAGSEEAWRRAELMTSMDGGSSWQAAGATAAPAVMGSALVALEPGQSALFDASSVLEVELLHEGMWLESRSDPALVAGANQAVVGSELIQFGRAEPLGQRRFRLSRLLRGRRGTEWAGAEHVSGEPFTLIEQASAAAIEVPVEALQSELAVMASSIGDLEPVEVTATMTGVALEPPAPVHLRAEPDGSGGLRISWVRRSRLGWSWPSGSDTPLAEEAECYNLRVGPRALTLSDPSYHYTAEQRSADASAGPVTIEVTQAGTFASSRPARLVLA